MSISTKAGITLAAFLCCHLLVAGQYAETIRTDRPGQAIVPYTVGKGVLQLQSGADRGWAKGPYFQTGRAISANATLRYGVTRTMELNTSWEYRQAKADTFSTQDYVEGFSGAAIGMRYNITEARKKRPAIGFQFSLRMPWLSQDFAQKNIAPQFLLTAAEGLTDRLTLTAIAGGNYDGNTAEPTGLYIVNLSYQIAAQVAVFAEGYGNVQGKMWEHRWDAGVAFLVNRNLQLDAYGGAGSNKGISDYFASVGVSYRIVPGRSRHKKENL